MKFCTECHVEKDESEFYFDKSVPRYLSKCKTCFSAIRKKYRQEYKKKNKQKIADQKKRYYIKNKDKIREKSRPSEAAYARKKRSEDPMYRFKSNVRRMIRKCFESNGYTKKSKTFVIVGCSFEDLKAHIENQFTDGMSWELVGRRIHIDHIIPLASACTEEELLKLNHYTNLQPLWAEDNLAKGSGGFSLSP